MRKTRSVAALCLGFIAFGCAAPSAAHDPLGTLNDDFRAVYAQARAQALAQGGPYLVVTFDAVQLHEGGELTSAAYTPELYHQYKRVAHAVLAAFALAQVCSDPLRESDVTALQQYLQHLGAARAHLPADGFPVAALERQQRLLDGATQALQSILAARRVDRARFDAALRAMAPDVLANVAAAARAQLDDLDRAVRTVTQTLDAGQRRSLHVVVMGTHQARDGCLQTTYFRKAMGEPGPVEDRLVFCELEFSQQPALAGKAEHLLGTHRLDEAAAAAMFGDRARLQSDILADAAARHVASMDVAVLR